MVDAQGFYAVIQPLHDALDVQPVPWDTDDEVIRLEAGADPRIPHHGRKIEPRRRQDHVPRLHVEEIVDDLETADVEIDNIVKGIPISLHELCGLAVEGLPIVKPRERICLHGALHLHNLPILGHLKSLAPFILMAPQHVSHPALNHRGMKGLCDEVRGAHLHRIGLALVIAVVEHGNHGNFVHPRGMLHDGHEINAVHSRHLHLQQDQIHPPGAHDSKSRAAIRHLGYLIIFPKKAGKNFPVRIRRIHNEYYRFFIHMIAFFPPHWSLCILFNIRRSFPFFAKIITQLFRRRFPASARRCRADSCISPHSPVRSPPRTHREHRNRSSRWELPPFGGRAC